MTRSREEISKTDIDLLLIKLNALLAAFQASKRESFYFEISYKIFYRKKPELTHLENFISSLGHQIKLIDARNDERQYHIHQLRFRIVNLEINYQAILKNQPRLISEINKLSNEISNLETSLNENSGDNYAKTHLIRQIQAYQEKIAELKHKLESNRYKSTQILFAIAEHQDQIKIKQNKSHNEWFKLYCGILREVNACREAFKPAPQKKPEALFINLTNLVSHELSIQKEAEWKGVENITASFRTLSSQVLYDSAEHIKFFEEWKVTERLNKFPIWCEMLRKIDFYLDHDFETRMLVELRRKLNLNKSSDGLHVDELANKYKDEKNLGKAYFTKPIQTLTSKQIADESLIWLPENIIRLMMRYLTQFALTESINGRRPTIPEIEEKKNKVKVFIQNLFYDVINPMFTSCGKKAYPHTVLIKTLKNFDDEFHHLVLKVLTPNIELPGLTPKVLPKPSIVPLQFVPFEVADNTAKEIAFVTTCGVLIGAGVGAGIALAPHIVIPGLIGKLLLGSGATLGAIKAAGATVISGLGSVIGGSFAAIGRTIKNYFSKRKNTECRPNDVLESVPLLAEQKNEERILIREERGSYNNNVQQSNQGLRLFDSKQRFASPVRKIEVRLSLR